MVYLQAAVLRIILRVTRTVLQQFHRQLGPKNGILLEALLSGAHITLWSCFSVLCAPQMCPVISSASSSSCSARRCQRLWLVLAQPVALRIIALLSGLAQAHCQGSARPSLQHQAADSPAPWDLSAGADPCAAGTAPNCTLWQRINVLQVFRLLSADPNIILFFLELYDLPPVSPQSGVLKCRRQHKLQLHLLCMSRHCAAPCQI